MSLPRTPSGHFAKVVPDGAPNLPAAAKASGVPGALRCKPAAEPFVVLEIEWSPKDAFESPVGYALAWERYRAIRAAAKAARRAAAKPVDEPAEGAA